MQQTRPARLQRGDLVLDGTTHGAFIEHSPEDLGNVWKMGPLKDTLAALAPLRSCDVEVEASGKGGELKVIAKVWSPQNIEIDAEVSTSMLGALLRIGTAGKSYRNRITLEVPRTTQTPTRCNACRRTDLATQGVLDSFWKNREASGHVGTSAYFWFMWSPVPMAGLKIALRPVVSAGPPGSGFRWMVGMLWTPCCS